MIDETMKRIEELSKIKEGRYVLVDGEVWRVLSIVKSKAGKHGHAKARIVLANVKTDARKELIKQTSAKIEVPTIDKRPAQILNVRKNAEGKTIASLMDSESYETFELEVPSEMIDKVVEGTEIIYWNVMGERMLKSTK